VGTAVDEYRASGGRADVGTAARRTLGWLAAVREAHQAARGRDRHELVIAWARRHL
jgi:Arc/MetJ family transcription regulator